MMRDIGWAVKQMHHGDQVRRAGWNGKGMLLVLVKNWGWGDIALCPGGDNLPFIMMQTAQGDFVPWLCSQTDILALDWEIAA